MSVTVRASIALVALVAIAQTGCALGFGSSYVGQWRAHEEIDFNACLEDESGRCVEEKQMVRQVPERKFWGFMMNFPVGGLGAVYYDDSTKRGFAPRFDTSLELLRGSGKYAFGVRTGITFDNAFAAR
jgi:hypothetical protein